MAGPAPRATPHVRLAAELGDRSGRSCGWPWPTLARPRTAGYSPLARLLAQQYSIPWPLVYGPSIQEGFMRLSRLSAVSSVFVSVVIAVACGSSGNSKKPDAAVVKMDAAIDSPAQVQNALGQLCPFITG